MLESKSPTLDKQRELPFQIMYVFCLSCPSATFAFQRGGFVPHEWLAAKGLLGTVLVEATLSHKQVNKSR